MTQPIIHDYLTQIFAKHYKMEPKAAAEAALKFIDILELYQMQLICGEWVVPEPIAPTIPTRPARPATGWDRLIIDLREIKESGREPWLAREIQ